MSDTKIVAGDTLSQDIAAPKDSAGEAYTAAEGWTLTYRLLPRDPAASAVTVNAVADGDDYTLAVAASATLQPDALYPTWLLATPQRLGVQRHRPLATTVIDYLGLLRSGTRGQSAYERMSEHAVELKEVAKRTKTAATAAEEEQLVGWSGRMGGSREALESVRKQANAIRNDSARAGKIFAIADSIREEVTALLDSAQ
jgi:hypothetical protein